MVSMKAAALTLVPLLALQASAAVEVEQAEILNDGDAISAKPTLNVQIRASFPQSEIFGVKLVNGHATQAVLSINNEEPESILVRTIGGMLSSPQSDVVLRNLSAVQYNIEIPAGQNQSLTYNFATEMNPQDLKLTLAAIVDKANLAYQIPAFNGTVSVVEAPISFFDPQIIFLYLFLLSVFGSTCYFIYRTWIKTLFPQSRRGGKGGERAKGSTQGKRVNPADQVAVAGEDGPAVTTGSKSYDASWIPAQHLQRPEAKRIRSGTPKTRSK